MSLLRIFKTFEQTHKIKIGKSLKRVDSDCIFLVFQTLPTLIVVIHSDAAYGKCKLALEKYRIEFCSFTVIKKTLVTVFRCMLA